MVSSIIALTGLASTAACISDALTPMKMPEDCGKKSYAFLQYASLAMVSVAAVGSIFAFVIANAPFFLICAAFIPICLIASYSVKQLAIMKSIEADAQNLEQTDHGMEQTAVQYQADNQRLLTENADLKSDITRLEQEKKDLATLQTNQAKENQDLKADADRLQKLPAQFSDTLTHMTADVQSYASSMKLLSKDDQDMAQTAVNLQTLAGTLQQTNSNIRNADKDIASQIQQMTESAQVLQQIFKSMVDLNSKTNKADQALAAQVAQMQQQLAGQKAMIAELHAFNTSTDKQLAASAASRASADDLLRRAAEMLGK